MAFARESPRATRHTCERMRVWISLLILMELIKVVEEEEEEEEADIGFIIGITNISRRAWRIN